MQTINKIEVVAVESALSMYEGEPCRICGEIITNAKTAVYVGYSKDNMSSRAAHKTCWDSNTPQSKWAYPESE